MIPNEHETREPRVYETTVTERIGRDPKEGNSGKPGNDRGAKESKPGKDVVSKKTKDSVNNIIKSNSIAGTGKLTTEIQRTEILRQLENERVIAASEGRRADSKFIEKERDRIKKMKLYVEGVKAPPKKPKPANDRSRNDGGTH